MLRRFLSLAMLLSVVCLSVRAESPAPYDPAVSCQDTITQGLEFVPDTVVCQGDSLVFTGPLVGDAVSACGDALVEWTLPILACERVLPRIELTASNILECHDSSPELTASNPSIHINGRVCQ